MSPSSLTIRILLTLIILFGLSIHQNANAASPEEAAFNQGIRETGVETYGHLPLSFEANYGQNNDPQVRFLTRGQGYVMFLTATGVTLALNQRVANDTPEPAQPSVSVVQMSLIGANPASQMSGLTELPGRSNYLIGSDPDHWQTNIPTYERVEYKQVWPGIDLVFYGNRQQLEYDFVVEPGANPAQIRLGFSGVEALWLDPQTGDLLLKVSGREIRQHAPLVYQEVDGVRKAIESRFVLDGQQVSFELGAYDPTLPVVIDPVLAYSTFLGGGGNANSIAVDSAGNVYITGYASSANHPTTAGAYDTSQNGSSDVFVTKLNPAGTALIYSTFIGGSGDETGKGIAVDETGNAYITGNTSSSNFPRTSGAYDSSYNGSGDAFVTKLRPGTGGRP